MYGVLVEFEGEGLKKGDVVGKYLLIREVQLQYYDTVDVVVGQEVVYGGGGGAVWKLKTESHQYRGYSQGQHHTVIQYSKKTNWKRLKFYATAERAHHTFH